MDEQIAPVVTPEPEPAPDPAIEPQAEAAPIAVPTPLISCEAFVLRMRGQAQEEMCAGFYHDYVDTLPIGRTEAGWRRLWNAFLNAPAA